MTITIPLLAKVAKLIPVVFDDLRKEDDDGKA